MNSLSLLLQDISKYEVLDKHKELLYFKKYNETKSLYYKELLINSNLKLVVKIALEYKGIKDLEDIILDASIGLSKAIDKFDYKKGIRFSTYATFWIRQAILKELNNKELIRIPKELNDKLRKINKEIIELEVPNYNKLSKKLNINTNHLEELINISNNNIISLDKENIDGGRLLDTISDNDIKNNNYIIKEVLNILNTLDDKSKNIIKMHYGIAPYERITLEEISKKYNITKERVRQIEAKTLRLIRNNLESKKLDNYINI